MVFEAAKFFFVSSQSRHLGFVTSQVARKTEVKSELDKCFVATSTYELAKGSGSQIWTSLIIHVSDFRDFNSVKTLVIDNPCSVAGSMLIEKVLTLRFSQLVQLFFHNW